MKKLSGDIIILSMCTENYDHMMYGFWVLVMGGLTGGRKKGDIEVGAPPINCHQGNISFACLQFCEHKCLNMQIIFVFISKRRIKRSDCKRFTFCTIFLHIWTTEISKNIFSIGSYFAFYISIIIDLLYASSVRNGILIRKLMKFAHFIVNILLKSHKMHKFQQFSSTI